MKTKRIFLVALFGAMMIMNGACSSKSKAKGNSMDSIKNKEGIFAVMDTSKGQIVLELYYKDAPLTVCNFVGLAEGTLDAASGKPFYDGLKFHRVIKDFMIQGGDPRGNGTGGPGYKFADESVPYKFTEPGYLAMANAGANTNGSQFFITHVPTEWLNGKHTIFGHVIGEADQAVVNAVAQGDEIKSVKIIRNGDDAKAFTCAQADWDKYAEEATAKALAAKEAMFADTIAQINKKFPGYSKSVDGIWYKTTKEGKGEKAGKGKNVNTDYKGYFLDGQVFDGSKALLKGGHEPLDFTTAVGMMIPGFDVMVQDMKVGEIRTCVLPPDMAYGERGIPGAIPENAFLCFDIQLNSIK
ncbi:MAG: peptidylprolyl isomerase [Treponema sp.]|nr:peptidylprolyl isomerase [Treponema sp.]